MYQLHGQTSNRISDLIIISCIWPYERLLKKKINVHPFSRVRLCVGFILVWPRIVILFFFCGAAVVADDVSRLCLASSSFFSSLMHLCLYRQSLSLSIYICLLHTLEFLLFYSSSQHTHTKFASYNTIVQLYCIVSCTTTIVKRAAAAAAAAAGQRHRTHTYKAFFFYSHMKCVVFFFFHSFF